MSGAMRKMGVYLGLLEDSGRYDEEYDEYETEAPEQERRPAPVRGAGRRRPWPTRP